jgi:WD40 repeat protein
LNRGARWALNIATTPDARIVAAIETADSELQKKIIYLFDAQQGRVIKRSPVADDTIVSLQLSDDGRFVAWGVEGKLHIWDWQKQAAPVVVQAHNSAVRMIAFSPDGRLLASGASDQFIRIWDSSTGKLLDIRKGHQNSVRALAFSADGQWLLSGGLNEAVRVWSLARAHERDVVENVLSGGRKQLPLHQRELAISDDSQWIALAGSSNSANTFSLPTLETAAAISNVEKVLRFDRDGRLVLAGRINAGPLGLFLHEKRNGALAPLLTKFLTLNEAAALAVSTDLRWMAIATNKSRIELWNLSSGSAVTNFPAHRDTIHWLAFAPKGDTIASCSRDGAIKLWSVPTAACIATFNKHRDDVFHVAFSRDGRLLASASTDKTVRLWDVRRQRQIAALEGHRHAVYAAGFSPDGKILASGSIDNTVKLGTSSSNKRSRISTCPRPPSLFQRKGY